MKNPVFTMPTLAEVAQNALSAHFEDRLQATSTRHAGRGSHYYDPTTRCSCVLGASMPEEIALALDKEEYPSIVDLFNTRTIGLPGFGAVEQARFLQTLHDQITPMRMGRFTDPAAIAAKQRELLDRLKKLAGGRP